MNNQEWCSPKTIAMYLQMTNDALEVYQKQLQIFEGYKHKISEMDVSNIVPLDRTLKKHRQQHGKILKLASQCRYWQEGKLTKKELTSIDEILANLHKIEILNHQIMFLVETYQEHTVRGVGDESQDLVDKDRISQVVDKFLEETDS